MILFVNLTIPSNIFNAQYFSAWKDTIHRTNCDCKGYDISCHKKNLTKLPSHLPTDGIGRLYVHFLFELST